MATTDFRLRSVSDQLDERIPAPVLLAGILLGLVGSLGFAGRFDESPALVLAVVALFVVIGLTAAVAVYGAFLRVTGRAKRTGRVPMRMTSSGLAGCPSPRPRR
jgi:hypothetical protein